MAVTQNVTEEGADSQLSAEGACFLLAGAQGPCPTAQGGPQGE